MNVQTLTTSLTSVAAPKRAVAPEVQAMYDTTDKLVASTQGVLQQAPDTAATFRQLAGQTRAEFKASVLAVDALPATAEEARKTAMHALWAGLMAGALDGTIALVAQGMPAPTPVPPPPAAASADPNSVADDIKADLEKLMHDLGRAADNAAATLKAVGPETMQITSKAQKKMAALAVDQSSLFPSHPETNVKIYQTYLGGLFAMGYGVAINDAALTVLAGQTPKQP